MSDKIQKTDAEWKAILAEKGAEPVAFEVTRHAATERAFTGKYEAVCSIQTPNLMPAAAGPASLWRSPARLKNMWTANTA